MAKKQESKEYVMGKKGTGEVKIASDVVAVIAALAACEVDGVSTMLGEVSNELLGKMGVKKLSKGVKAVMSEGMVRIDIMIQIKYGYSIPDTIDSVQNRVSQQIENMTGLGVEAVNVRVAGVNL